MDKAEEVIILWNPSRKDLAERDKAAIICLETPVFIGISFFRKFRFICWGLGKYMLKRIKKLQKLGVPDKKIAIVGDMTLFSDQDYCLILNSRMMILPDRESAKICLRMKPPSLNKTFAQQPYSFDPGPPRVTAEELQAHIEAIAKRKN